MEPGTDKLQVLLVEDRHDAARAVAVACRDLTLPVELTAVSDIESARARLQTGDYDVVLLEAQMAGMPGVRAMTELRDVGRSVPFVALTPTYDADLAQDFLDAGADDWLSLADEMNCRMLARVMGHAIERHHLWQAVREHTHIDSLTGVLNERGFRHAVRQQLALAARDMRPLAVLVLDVDRMQEINNEYGWNEGDRVLETVADVVRRTFRVSDIVGRTADDEFAVLLCGNGFRDVDAGVSRVMANLDLYAEALVLPYSLTVSVGWTVTQPERALEVDEVLDHARNDLLNSQAPQIVAPRAAGETLAPDPVSGETRD